MSLQAKNAPKRESAETLFNNSDTALKNNAQERKPQASLLPLKTLIKHLTPAYEEGVIKYHRGSWRKGFHTTVMLDAALRHIAEFAEGHDYDEESEVVYGIRKHHLAGAVFSLVSILYTLDIRPDLDNREVTRS